MKRRKLLIVRFHTMLLRLYPAQYRAEFGNEILITFGDMIAAADTLDALMLLVWHEVRDWPSTVCTEHWRCLQASVALRHRQQQRIQHSRPGLLPPEMAEFIPPAIMALIERNPFVNRLLDLLLAGFWLLLLSPLLLILFVLVRVDSVGPAIYRQTRSNATGQSYIMFKFRSMTIEPSERASRITRIGVLLRNSKLDEVPQLFNILRGEMRLIGPRPGPPN